MTPSWRGNRADPKVTEAENARLRRDLRTVTAERDDLQQQKDDAEPDPRQAQLDYLAQVNRDVLDATARSSGWRSWDEYLSGVHPPDAA
jgi:hypothetical protein